MPRDSYHGDTRHLALGLRLGDLAPGTRIGACCIRCDRFRVYGDTTFRHFRSDMPVDWLYDVLMPFCRAKASGQGLCGRWFVSPDDGCSDAG